MHNRSELLLIIRMHLHLAGGESIAHVPLVLLTAGLAPGSPLLLPAWSVHIVRSPSVLIVPGGVAYRVVGGNVLYLTWSHTLRGSIDLMRNSRIVQGVLVFRILRWSVLAEPAVALPVVLDRHVHPVLRVTF